MYSNINDIDRQIDYLGRIKNACQNMQPNPINIYNNSNNIEFEARLIDSSVSPSDIIVNRKTAFICFDKSLLTIKELNGDIKEYEIIIPKTKEQIENEELKKRIKELESELEKK